MMAWTRRPSVLAVLAVALGLASVGSAQAGTVRGTVRNGTTGQPAAGVELTLVQPMGGMQELAHAKSGPQGEFSFDNPNLGTQPNPLANDTKSKVPEAKPLPKEKPKASSYPRISFGRFKNDKTA